MVKGLEAILVKIQSVFGTPATDLVSIGTTNYYFPATDNSKIDINPQFTPIDVLSGGFDQDASVRGNILATAEIGCYMKSVGTLITSLPEFGTIAQTCGLEYSAGNSGTLYIHYYGCGTTKDLTIWHYSGGFGSNQSLLRKLGNVVGDWKITGEAGKPVLFTMTGKGIYTSESVSTIPTFTIPKDRSVIAAAVPLTVLIGDQVYNVLKFEISGNNVVEQYGSNADAYGTGESVMADVRVKMSFTAYADITKTFPLDTAIANTPLTAMTFTFGIAGQKITMDTSVSSKLFLINCKQEKQGNLTIWDCSGIVTDNAFIITVNSDAY